MFKKYIFIIVFILTAFLSAVSFPDYNKPFQLDKNWDCFWNRLLDPCDFKNSEISPDFVHDLPFFWNDLKRNGETFPAIGCLTLRKIIQLPDSLIGEQIGLRIPEMFTAFKLYVNGEVVAQNGYLEKRDHQPEWRPITTYFRSEVNRIEFILQISNHEYSWGGSWRNIEIGRYISIARKTNFNIFLEIFLFSSVLTMGFYHLGIFLKRRKAKDALYFFLLCLVVAFRTVVSGEMIINHAFTPPWRFLVSLNLLTVALLPMIFIKFQQHLFPSCTKKNICRLSVYLSTLYSIIILITPVYFFSSLLKTYHLVILLSGVYIVYVFVRAVRSRLYGAIFSFSAFIVLFLTAINDVLAVNNFVNTEQIFPFGLIVFFIAQSFILAQRYSEALIREEILAHKLEDLNENLEEKVAERTNELKLALSEIKQLSGLLPICAKCKKIRDDQGYWNQIEEYLEAHSEAVLTHSMCPDCIDEMYPQLKGKIKTK